MLHGLKKQGIQHPFIKQLSYYQPIILNKTASWVRCADYSAFSSDSGDAGKGTVPSQSSRARASWVS